jgi:hypothetical protein
MHPSRTIPALKSAIPGWVEQWHFTRFVTLTFNDVAVGEDRMRERLRRWDALINGEILGRDWATRHADRMFAIYFPEKVESNPHWHGLIRFFALDDSHRQEQERIFDLNAERLWEKLVPRGSLDNQPIYDLGGAAEYVAKAAGNEVLFERFITPDAFGRG